MKTILLFMMGLVTLSALNAQNRISISDFKNLDGSSWSGSLMYVDYGNGKQVTLRTTMQIELEIEDETVIIHTQYTDEPSANGTSNLRITNNGGNLNKEKVVKKEILSNGGLNFITLMKGKDNNKPAKIYTHYTIGETLFSITKKVIYDESQKVLIRSRFTYTKLQ
ncbi:MAG: hypothetical protein AAFZ89_07920 [Bacteroidota bacterium]